MFEWLLQHRPTVCVIFFRKEHHCLLSGCKVQRSGPASAQMMLVLTFAPCACGGSHREQLMVVVFLSSRWHKDSPCTRGVFTHCNLWRWCSSFHTQAQIPDIHSGNWHCVVVIYLYTSATELHPKCGVTLHMTQYRKVIPRQVAMLDP